MFRLIRISESEQREIEALPFDIDEYDQDGIDIMDCDAVGLVRFCMMNERVLRIGIKYIYKSALGAKRHESAFSISRNAKKGYILSEDNIQMDISSLDALQRINKILDGKIIKCLTVRCLDSYSYSALLNLVSMLTEMRKQQFFEGTIDELIESLKE